MKKKSSKQFQMDTEGITYVSRVSKEETLNSLGESKLSAGDVFP